MINFTAYTPTFTQMSIPSLQHFGLVVTSHSDATNASKSVTPTSKPCCDSKVVAWPLW